MNENNMKNNLYIINEVLYDYSDGMVVIAAASLERARELFIKEFVSSSYDGDRQLDEFDAAIESGACKVLEVVGQSEGVVSYVYGGG